MAERRLWRRSSCLFSTFHGKWPPRKGLGVGMGKDTKGAFGAFMLFFSNSDVQGRAFGEDIPIKDLKDDAFGVIFSSVSLFP